MKIYHYDSRTNEFVGQSDADESPLEPGVFLIPAFATDQTPPTPGANQKVVWRNGAWEIQDIPQPTPEPQPTAEEVKQQKLAALDAEYQPLFNQLSISWATASMDGNTVLADSIKADKGELTAEYLAKREAIENAN